MTRAILYARYSSDNQREVSIEDQVQYLAVPSRDKGARPVAGGSCRYVTADLDPVAARARFHGVQGLTLFHYRRSNSPSVRS